MSRDPNQQPKSDAQTPFDEDVLKGVFRSPETHGISELGDARLAQYVIIKANALSTEAVDAGEAYKQGVNDVLAAHARQALLHSVQALHFDHDTAFAQSIEIEPAT